MIVGEEHVAAALGYLGDDEAAAKARYDVAVAENAAKETFARLYLSYNTGTIAEREARVACNPEYQEAKAVEAEALREQERHKARANSADKIISVWQSENANARAAERVR